MALFVLERDVPLPAAEAWHRLTRWERHADVVPLTRVTVLTPPPAGEGTTFVARTGVGPLAFDDPMEVVGWRAPREERPGWCRLVKRGSFVTGWAEIEVHATGAGSARVIWREELRVRWLPRLFDGPLAWAGRGMFGRAMTGLLKHG